MENVIVIAALLIVILLLAVVVYDTNPTLRQFVGRLLKAGRQGEEPSEEQEVAMDEFTDVGEKAQEEELIRLQQTMKDQLDTLKREMRSDINILKREINPGADEPEESSSILKKAIEQISKITREIGRWLQGIVGSLKKSDGDTKDSLSSALSTLHSTVNDLSNRLARAEAALGGISQLKKALAKISEDTKTASEEMKDVIESLRLAMDVLESRLDQVTTDQVEENGSKRSGDEENRNKINQLEEAIENINVTIGSLPQQVQNTERNIREVSNRLQSVSADLQRTLGYRIQETFKCDSCGSEGLVASQVMCSKCGAGSMWGWWPQNEDLTGEENEATEMGIEATESGG